MKKILCLILCTVILTGCGFHLRGSTNVPAELKTLYLQTEKAYSPLQREIQSQLQESNIRLVSSQDEATFTLKVSQESVHTAVTNVSATAEVKQLSLTDKFTFNIVDKYNHPVLHPRTISTTRTFTVNTNLITANSTYVKEMLGPMRRELVFQMLIHLESEDAKNALHQYAVIMNAKKSKHKK